MMKFFIGRHHSVTVRVKTKAPPAEASQRWLRPQTTDKQEVTTLLHLHLTPEADGASRGTRAATVSLFPFMYSDVGHVTHVELQLFTRLQSPPWEYALQENSSVRAGLANTSWQPPPHHL